MYRRLFLLLTVLIFFAMGGTAATALQTAGDADVWIILADLSGSMQENVNLSRPVDDSLPTCAPTETENAETDDDDDRTSTKAALIKRLIVAAGQRLAADGRLFGLLAVEYVAGRRTCYRNILSIQQHEAGDLADRICEHLDVDTPVFNRRSPLGEVLRQVDDDLLATLNGNITLVVFSDGRDSFYDYEDDRQASRADLLDPAANVQGPITESRRLHEHYPDRVQILTVLVESEKAAQDDAVGRIRLTEMAEAGRGVFLDATIGYRDPGQFETLIHTLTHKGASAP